MADPAHHSFTDPVSHRTVVLRIGDETGVEHGDCPTLADVSPELDAFYCPSCRWNGRISGAWFAHMVALARVVDGG